MPTPVLSFLEGVGASSPPRPSPPLLSGSVLLPPRGPPSKSALASFQGGVNSLQSCWRPRAAPGGEEPEQRSTGPRPDGKLTQRVKAEPLLRIPAAVGRTEAARLSPHNSPLLMVPSRYQWRFQPDWKTVKSCAYFYLHVFAYFLAVLDFYFFFPHQVRRGYRIWKYAVAQK